MNLELLSLVTELSIKVIPLKEWYYAYLYEDLSEIGEFDPTDATTNPSLVLVAVSKTEYSFLLDNAVHYAQARLPDSSVDEQTQLALDYLVFYYLSNKNYSPFNLSFSVSASRCTHIEHNSRSCIYLC